MTHQWLQLAQLFRQLAIGGCDEALVSALVFTRRQGKVLCLQQCLLLGVTICHCQDYCHNSNIFNYSLQTIVDLLEFVLALQIVYFQLVLNSRDVHCLGIQGEFTGVGSNIIGC